MCVVVVAMIVVVVAVLLEMVVEVDGGKKSTFARKRTKSVSKRTRTQDEWNDGTAIKR
jgi:hypothetical protein